MKRVKEEVSKSDALLIDLTLKPTWRAMVAWIAYTLGKPVITIMKHGTPIKDTMKGISHTIIEYDSMEDAISPLTKTLGTIV